MKLFPKWLLIPAGTLMLQLDRWLFSGMVWLISRAALALAWASGWFDERVLNYGFDEISRPLRRFKPSLSRALECHPLTYVLALVIGWAIVVLILLWGYHRS